MSHCGRTHHSPDSGLWHFENPESGFETSGGIAKLTFAVRVYNPGFRTVPTVF